MAAATAGVPLTIGKAVPRAVRRELARSNGKAMIKRIRARAEATGPVPPELAAWLRNERKVQIRRYPRQDGLCDSAGNRLARRKERALVRSPYKQRAELHRLLNAYRFDG